MTRRQLLAFKRGPTVEIRRDELIVEVRDNRVHFATAGGAEYLSWDEWRVGQGATVALRLCWRVFATARFSSSASSGSSYSIQYATA